MKSLPSCHKVWPPIPRRNLWPCRAEDVHETGGKPISEESSLEKKNREVDSLCGLMWVYDVQNMYFCICVLFVCTYIYIYCFFGVM